MRQLGRGCLHPLSLLLTKSNVFGFHRSGYDNLVLAHKWDAAGNFSVFYLLSKAVTVTLEKAQNMSFM